MTRRLTPHMEKLLAELRADGGTLDCAAWEQPTAQGLMDRGLAIVLIDTPGGMFRLRLPEARQ